MEENEFETAVEETPGPGAAPEEVEQLRQELEASRENERAAVERLRAALLVGEPALAPEMLAGETLAEVEANYRRALAVLTKLREQVAKETAGRIPAACIRPMPRTPRSRSICPCAHR